MFQLNYLAATTLLIWISLAQAQAVLSEAEALEAALKLEPPCCVIDARSEDNQRKLPLEDVLRYRPSMTITPTASVVVVGDNDRGALAIADALSKQHPGKTIYAVKGGAAIWKTVQHTLDETASSAAGGSPKGLSFVIPKNTCESGTTLQTLTGSSSK